MKSLKLIPISFLLAALLCHCSEQSNRYKKMDADVPVVNSQFIRMDKDIYALTNCITQPTQTGNYDLMTVNIPDQDSICISQTIENLSKQYADKFDLYLYQLGAMTGAQVNPTTLFYLFLSHPAYNELYNDCEKVYENTDELQKEFNKSFARAKSFIPTFKVPSVCTFFSGFAEYIATDTSTIYISLEYFLGTDYKNYEYVPGIYDYMIQNLKREKIVPDALYHWICSEYPIQKEAANLLDNMIHYGKMLYVLEALLPQTDEKLLIGYNQEQWEWCENNEKQMWNYLREYNQLFSTDSKTISDYMFQANNTKYFSDETHQAPCQAALWIGWKIVKEYMNQNKNISLSDLLINDVDAQTILTQSNYKP